MIEVGKLLVVKKGYTITMYGVPPKYPYSLGEAKQVHFGEKLLIKQTADSNGWILVIDATGQTYKVSNYMLHAYVREA